MTNERPWLWAVFIIVVVLPVVLIVAYCCMSKVKDFDKFGLLGSLLVCKPWLLLGVVTLWALRPLGVLWL